MAHLAKDIGLLCLLALTVSAQASPDAVSDNPKGKIQIAGAKSMLVNYPARVATPIKYTAADYDGPYDPLDPNGVIAARHRHMKLVNKKNAEVVKSYVPPGIDNVAKKEMSKVIMGEGKRFAFSHPKETSDILGIAMKAKKLFHTAEEKLKKMEAEGHH